MLFEFAQGPKPVFQTDRDLKSSLRDLSNQRWSWPEKSALLPFARKSLGVKPQDEDAWYRSACWGYYAARLIEVFTYKGYDDIVCSLLDPDSDWSALEQALVLGNGAVILSAHLGPGRIPAYAANRRGYRVRQIAKFKTPGTNENQDDYIFVSSDAEMKTSVIKGLKHLRSGGVIAAAGTGQTGGQHLKANLLGNPLTVYLGISELVQLSGAPAFWATCSWTAPDRLRLIIEPLPRPSANGEDWHKQFLEAYFSKVGYHMKKFPSDLGFSQGFWDADEGLPWYQPQAAQSQHRLSE